MQAELRYSLEDNHNQDYYQFEYLRDREVWSTVKKTEGRQPTKYEVSTFGRRRKTYLKTGKVDTYYGATNNNGYKVFGGLGLAHCVVAKAFIPSNPLNKPEVNHIDGCKSNNHISNLEWATSSEQTQHAYATGLIDRAKISEALKGRFPDSYDDRIHRFKNVVTNQIVEGLFLELKRNAKELFGLSSMSIQRLRYRGRKQVKNWVYLGVIAKIGLNLD